MQKKKKRMMGSGAGDLFTKNRTFNGGRKIGVHVRVSRKILIIHKKSYVWIFFLNLITSFIE